MTPPSASSSLERRVTVLSLILASLSLATSCLVLFTGNGNQARFEADRQRCLDDLSSISESLRDVYYARVVTPAVYSSFTSSRVAAEKTCFGGQIFAGGTDYQDSWSRSLDIFANEKSWRYDTPLTGDLAASLLPAIGETLTVNDNVFAQVQYAPGAGAFPWQYPRPLNPVVLP